MNKLSSEYVARFYEDGDEPQIVELLDSVFRGWPKLDIACSKVDYWRWKHLDNPVNSSVVLVTEKDNQVVGSNHSMPVRIKVGEEEILGVLGVDLAVDREHRRQGVRTLMRGKKLERLIPLGVSHGYYMTGNPIVIESSNRRKQPRFPNPVAPYVRINNLDMHLHHMPVDDPWVKKLGYRTLKMINRIENSIASIPETDLIEVNRIDSFTENINEFWEKISKHYDYISVRDRDFLNWKYSDPRAGHYTIFQAKEEDVIQGYIIVCINRFNEEYPVGFIVDLLTLPDKMDITYPLLAEAMDYFEENDVNIVNSLVVKGSNFEAPFSRLGFLDSRIDLHIFLRRISGDKELARISNFHPDRLHFTWGDHDTLPLKTTVDN